MVEAFDIDPAANAFWIANGMESKRYEYNVHAGETIVDIGAYQGEWSRSMHEIYKCNSIMFEPVDRLAEFKDSGWASVWPAAWVFDGHLDFGGSAYWTSHYLSGNQRYPCVDINKFLTIPIAVCKINIEGAEYLLLEHIMNAKLHLNIRNLQVQFHKIEGHQKYYRLIAEKLKETHTRTWGVPWVWESWELKLR